MVGRAGLLVTAFLALRAVLKHVQNRCASFVDQLRWFKSLSNAIGYFKSYGILSTELDGGSCWIRTSDQLIKSQLLYQLS